MPTLEELENSIIEQCIDQSGILTTLHDNKFDVETCRSLINTLTDYQNALGKQKYISRKMASYMRTIENIFDVAVAVHNRQLKSLENDYRLIAAHAQILDLMDNIFDANLED